jgi:RNA polymerase sigma factor (sigma-70 family)
MPDSKNLTDGNSQSEPPALPAELYEALPALIHAACRQFHYDPKPDQIENLRGEIILQLLENDGHRLQTFDSDKASLHTWLHTLVRNYVGKRLKRRRKWDSLEDVLPEVLLEQPRQELNVSAHEEFVAVARVVAKMSARQQELFRLVCAELSTAEIAKRLKIKPESVRRMKHGLRQKIKAGLEKTGGANYVPKGLRRKIKIIEKSESTFLLEKTIWLVKAALRFKMRVFSGNLYLRSLKE